ncbi:hypothetical protein [Promicromonospora soli]
MPSTFSTPITEDLPVQGDGGSGEVTAVLVAVGLLAVERDGDGAGLLELLERAGAIFTTGTGGRRRARGQRHQGEY